jgi:hypothetical protein
VLVDAIDERAVEIEEEGRSVIDRFVLPAIETRDVLVCSES